MCSIAAVWITCYNVILENALWVAEMERFWGKTRVKRAFIVLAIVLLALIVVVFISCGGGKGGGTMTSRIGGSGNVESEGGAATCDNDPSRAIAIENVVEEIRSAPTPEKADERTFNALCEELIKQLLERAANSPVGRIPMGAPTGDAGRVIDLSYNSETNMLSWSYVNLGDYDLSGEVGVSDITPIAQNYLAQTNDLIGDDALETWIDGDQDGEIGIADITPIAANYLNDVAGYKILSWDSTSGVFTQIGTHVPYGDSSSFPRVFNVILPVGAGNYVAVRSKDNNDGFGAISNVVGIDEAAEPRILSVNVNSSVGNSFTCGIGDTYEINALVYSSAPLSYNWNFGSAINPSTSAEVSPFITPSTLGGSQCSLSVASSFGNDTYEFDINVVALPKAISVSPLSGKSGDIVRFTAVTEGDNLEYLWNFGGGAQPNILDSEEARVKLGLSGKYLASLSVSNEYGTSKLTFEVSVSPSWHIEILPVFSSGTENISFALDSRDSPQVAYFDHNTRTANYANINNNEWNITVVDDEYYLNPSNTYLANGKWVSLAIDKQDYPHISYCSYGDFSYSSLKCAIYDGSRWNKYFVDLFVHSPYIGDVVVGTYTAIALDSQNIPHICYKSHEYLKHAYNNGAEWVISSVDTIGPYDGYTSIAIDSKNCLHISFACLKYESTLGGVKYAHYDGIKWDIVTIDSGGYCSKTSIDLDSDDNPHISYLGGYPNHKLEYAYFNGSSWSIETIHSEGGRYPSIVLDSNNRPHVSYYDDTSASLKYSYRNNNSWLTTVVSSKGIPASMAIDTKDRPHIMFYEELRLKYAWFG